MENKQLAEFTFDYQIRCRNGLVLKQHLLCSTPHYKSPLLTFQAPIHCPLEVTQPQEQVHVSVHIVLHSNPRTHSSVSC